MGYKDLKPTPVYDTYWEFAVKRQNVFFARINGEDAPWTEDDIIQKYKFTNAYRASDRVSQFLIKNVIYEKDFSPEDLCFRILFFKLFNKVETWKYMENCLGEIAYSSYSFDKYNKLLLERISDCEKIYSAAYIMPSGKSCFGHERKHQNHLRLLEYMMNSEITKKVAHAKSLQELYISLLDYPTLGPFLAFQFAIDINYSELCDFNEMSYVVAGPGAKNGIMKCFSDLGGYSYEDIIRYVAEHQEEEFHKRDLNFKSLYGRNLQLIDCQNLFCETDKYARVAHPDICGADNRKKIKQKYVDHNYDKLDYFYPPKWGINTLVH